MQDAAPRTYTEEGTEGLQAEGNDDLQMTIALELFTEKTIGENPKSCGTLSSSRTLQSLMLRQSQLNAARAGSTVLRYADFVAGTVGRRRAVVALWRAA